jgi:VanZ family protein
MDAGREICWTVSRRRRNLPGAAAIAGDRRMAAAAGGDRPGLARLLRDARVRAGFVVLWAAGWAATFYWSLMPLRELPFGASDKTLHLLGYALMTLLSAGFCHAPAALLALAAGTVGASALIESVQGLLPYRSFELLDLAANAAGATLGGALALAWVTAVVRRAPPPRPARPGLSRRPLPS